MVLNIFRRERVSDSFVIGGVTQNLLIRYLGNVNIFALSGGRGPSRFIVSLHSSVIQQSTAYESYWVGANEKSALTPGGDAPSSTQHRDRQITRLT